MSLSPTDISSVLADETIALGSRGQHGGASAEHAGRPLRAELAAAVSKSVVCVLSESSGRGATTTRTYISDELIAVVLRDSLTKIERTLARDGGEGVVLELRRALQHAMRDSLIAAVEGVVGSRVLVLLSDHNVDPDIALEVFVLDGSPLRAPVVESSRQP
jgi:uncharacterized protein YbcI